MMGGKICNAGHPLLQHAHCNACNVQRVPPLGMEDLFCSTRATPCSNTPIATRATRATPWDGEQRGPPLATRGCNAGHPLRATHGGNAVEPLGCARQRGPPLAPTRPYATRATPWDGGPLLLQPLHLPNSVTPRQKARLLRREQPAVACGCTSDRPGQAGQAGTTREVRWFRTDLTSWVTRLRSPKDRPGKDTPRETGFCPSTTTSPAHTAGMTISASHITPPAVAGVSRHQHQATWSMTWTTEMASRRREEPTPAGLAPRTVCV
jgi:hypothetical protein